MRNNYLKYHWFIFLQGKKHDKEKQTEAWTEWGNFVFFFYFLTRLNWCMLLLRRSWFFNQKIFSSRFSDIFILRTGALQRKLKLRLPFWNKCTEKKREGIFSFSTVSIWKFSVPYRSPWSFLFTLEIKNMTFTTRLVEHNFKLYYGSLKS